MGFSLQQSTVFRIRCSPWSINLVRSASDDGIQVLWNMFHVVRHWFAVMMQKGGDPIVHIAVNDQVNSIFSATVINIVRKVEIQIPAFALRHIHPFAIKIKFDFRISYYRNMKSHHTVLMREVIVFVFAYT